MKTATLKPLKTLVPRTPDIKYTGSEPDWNIQPVAENRASQLATGFYWYGYHYGKKEVKEFILDWLTRSDRVKEAREFVRVPDGSITNVWGWLARMNLRGLILLPDEHTRLNNQIRDLMAAVRAVPATVKPSEAAAPKPNIQDRLREKIADAAGEIEVMYDDMINAGVKMSADHRPMSVLRGRNVAPQLVGTIASHWQQHLAELEQVVQGRDAQLVEGYSNFGKLQIKNLMRFCEQVITDCGNYVQIKKVERKPRAKKALSPDRLVSRFKFSKECKDLQLTSEAPAKLVGASEAYLYDTKKRKLIHVLADQHIGSFSVKGSSIVGFDTATSQQKTLRKPAEQIKALLASGKPAARKWFKEIRATEISFNGRGNDNLMILKIW